MMDQLTNPDGSPTTTPPTIEISNHRLQASKSSYQAWKCVSFGCSLLALVMLLSKLHEVTTDLKLLLGIEQLLTLQASSNASTNSSQLSWPPVPLEMLLPLANNDSSVGSFGMETMESNNSMLMSHMHMALNREFNGNQLLRQEVEVFAGEFKNAKSTLSLSSILVSGYLVSWILITLAVSDSGISNDISLRNILMLSVFGAIDMAASFGFVMVRVIMYSVKNGSFASEILATGGIKDTPVRLSSDQLTAFTALRLIAMRSCSAYMDIYVSVLVALLTFLRLYSIFRALSYYRQLRRYNDCFQYRQLHLEQQQQHQQHHLHHQAPQSPIEHKPIWSTSSFLNGQNNHTNNQIYGHQLMSPSSPKSRPFLQPRRDVRGRRYDAAFEATGSYHPLGLVEGDQENYGISDPSEQPQQPSTGTFRYNPKPMSSGSLPLFSRVVKESSPHSLKQNSIKTRGSLIVVPEQKQQPQHRTYTSNTLQQQPQRAKNTHSKHQQSEQAYRLSAPNLLVINGRAHRIVNEQDIDRKHHQPQGEALESEEIQSTGVKLRHLANSATTINGHSQQEELIMMSDQVIDANNNVEQAENTTFYTLEDDTKHTEAKKADLKIGTRTLLGTTMRDANGAAYTLLSAHQLDKLSRKLRSANGPSAEHTTTTTKTTTGKYKLVAHYKQSPQADTNAKQQIYLNNNPALAQQQQQQQVFQQITPQSTSSSSSASCGPDDSDGSLVITSQRVVGQERRNQRATNKDRRQFSKVRQTEEYLTAENQQQTKQQQQQQQVRQVFELASETVELSPLSIPAKAVVNQPILLGKYYYA